MRRDDIDQILQLRRMTQVKACYPCRRRKVKCDHAMPCRTCCRRGHPDICSYDVEEPTTSITSGPGSHTNSQSAIDALPKHRDAPSLISQGDPSHAETAVHVDGVTPVCQGQGQASGQRAYEGSSFLDMLRHDDSGAVDGETGSILGLRNTFDSYPFMEAPTSRERWKTLLDIVPQSDEVQRFLPSYQTPASAFSPMLVAVDELEDDVFRYLQSLGADELRDPDVVSEKWATNTSIAKIALLLAILATGAHYSILDVQERSTCCLNFLKRAFQALRLANFLLSPSLDAVHALLIIGHALQNGGQSECAWVLLGTTVRLAQSMGLHNQSFGQRNKDIAIKARSIWAAVVWQDGFLSLCHGRRPIVTLRDGEILRHGQESGAKLSYIESMQVIVRVCLEIAIMEDEPAINKSIDLLSEMDSWRLNTLPHLQSREHCKTLQQHFEYLALQINASFTVSVLCRPALKKPTQLGGDTRYGLLITRAKESLMATTEAFLEFQALSRIPLRTWSFVHSALTATLLLCMWDETWKDPSCRILHEKVVTVLQSGGSTGGTKHPDGSLTNNTNWLSGRHVRALVALQKALRKEQVSYPKPNAIAPGRSISGDPEQQIGVGEMYQGALQADSSLESQDSSALPYGSLDTAAITQEDLYTYPWGLTNLSPMTYLDAIMSVPFEDLAQYNIM